MTTAIYNHNYGGRSPGASFSPGTGLRTHFTRDFVEPWEIRHLHFTCEEVDVQGG